jgi:hypothetical protein
MPMMLGKQTLYGVSHAVLMSDLVDSPPPSHDAEEYKHCCLTVLPAEMLPVSHSVAPCHSKEPPTPSIICFVYNFFAETGANGTASRQLEVKNRFCLRSKVERATLISRIAPAVSEIWNFATQPFAAAYNNHG